ncbi:GPI ethanolamine phosphate transferase 2 [Hondaea fermentalgiana]|uniref:GPI ethanolamine phosphate transferase 2 n=1 Tax=Hondaea fermentalgiana TaxID=2315210 RepID=A0A2R5GM18_9STRA|nr:GPI ethanolamine phosphate transferase 2 [Hondaea fermentalgiana]|eukprot:GBG28914.1 GPI ethanolamine phosphate transferase 2 [Hondaea fermentalgiana]
MGPWTRTVILHVAQCAALVWVACVVLALDLPSPPWRITATTSTSSANEPIVSAADATTTAGLRPAYGRLVIMVVDALREDFVHERPEMRYVRQIMREEPERTASFVSDANTPTVTMPRIKALTTGTVPRFIDVMNNLNSKALAEDNLLDRLKAAGRRLVMYGDETWLKLFPHHFVRHDGTSSFFTKDFTEVDDNVTRHLAEDFDPSMQHPAAAAWDVAILHYLGVDHIGHSLGPDSSQLGVKLSEMDRIFEQLHRSLRQQDRIRANQAHHDASKHAYAPTLLVLLSDHGMNKVGNHGGASLPETSAFLLFAHVGATPPMEFSETEPRRRRHMAQVDLVPTLATLFDVGIPERSVGKILQEPFRSLADGSARYAAALEANAAQLERLVRREAPHLLNDDSMQMARSKDTESFVHRMHDAIYTARLGNGAAGDDERVLENVKLVIAVGVLALAALAGFARHVPWRELACPSYGLLGIHILHCLSLTSSSAIENEHVVWNFLVLSWLLGRGLHRLWQRICAASRPVEKVNVGVLETSTSLELATIGLVAVLLRVLRERLMIINFARLAAQDDEGNFVDEGTAVLVLPSVFYTPTVVALVLVLYGSATLWRLQRLRDTLDVSSRLLGAVLIIISMLLLFSLKVFEIPREASFGGLNELWRARAAYICAGSIFLWGGRATLARRDAWEFRMLGLEILLLLLHRKTGTAILCGAILLTRAAGEMHRTLSGSSLEVILFQWILGQCVFFALGNSHVISTVDISGAYTGLSDYNQTLVGSLTFVITFSGPILGVANAVRVLSLDHASGPTRRALIVATFVFQTCAALRIAVATGVLVAMRSHLFVWSVFAPKWMLETMLFFFQILAGFAFLAVAMR